MFDTDADRDESEAITGYGNLRMNDSDIWSHEYRMYLIGDNSISFPWYIPKDFPNKALDPTNREKLIKFIKMK